MSERPTSEPQEQGQGQEQKQEKGPERYDYLGHMLTTTDETQLQAAVAGVRRELDFLPRDVLAWIDGLPRIADTGNRRDALQLVLLLGVLYAPQLRAHCFQYGPDELRLFIPMADDEHVRLLIRGLDSTKDPGRVLGDWRARYLARWDQRGKARAAAAAERSSSASSAASPPHPATTPDRAAHAEKRTKER